MASLICYPFQVGSHLGRHQMLRQFKFCLVFKYTDCSSLFSYSLLHKEWPGVAYIPMSRCPSWRTLEFLLLVPLYVQCFFYVVYFHLSNVIYIMLFVEIVLAFSFCVQSIENLINFFLFLLTRILYQQSVLTIFLKENRKQKKKNVNFLWYT